LRSLIAQSSSEVIMKIQSQANNPVVQRGWLQLSALAFTLLMSCPVARAQESNDGIDLSEQGSRRNIATLLQTTSALDFIDISTTGAGHRPRGALRFRFDSATRALRGFGVEAEDCRTLLRTTSNRVANAGGGSDSGRRLGVTVSLNCSFF